MKANTKILIVEDTIYVDMFLREILSEMKIHNIVSVINGREAVKYCKKNDDVSLVLMDLVMPIMDGFEATQKIKEIRPNLPIIAQTALVTSMDKNKIVDAGCDAYISKPINIDEFKSLVTKFLIK